MITGRGEALDKRPKLDTSDVEACDLQGSGQNDLEAWGSNTAAIAHLPREPLKVVRRLQSALRSTAREDFQRLCADEAKS